MTALSDLFLWTAGTSASAALVALVVWGILRGAGRRIPVRGHYWLWSLVLVRLLLPTVPGTPWSPFNWLPASSSALPSEPAFMPAHAGAIEPAADPRMAQEQQALGASASRATPYVGPEALLPQSHRPWWLDALSAVWIAGALVYLAFILAQQIRFGRRVRAGEQIADAGTMRILAEVQGALNLRATVPLVALEGLSSPAVFGFVRPHLLLPRHMRHQLSDRELRHVLMHELAHVQRSDVLWNWVWIMLQAWHWFNPVVWLVVRRLRAERELLCDAAVLSRMQPGERSAYGATLLCLVSTSSQPAPAVTLVPALEPQHRHNLERRIRMISTYRPPTRWANAAAASLAVIVAAMMFTRAAEKSGGAQPAPAVVPADPTPSAVTQAQRERGIRTLEDEVDKLYAMARERQEAINVLRVRLEITESDEQRPGGPISKLRAIEVERVSAQAKHAQSATLYAAFTNMSRRELKQALPTASPDALLSRLLEEQALAERTALSILEKFPNNHPQYVAHIRLLEKIEQQIDERLNGILRGLQVRLSSEQELVQSLERAAASVRQQDIKSTIDRTPYYEAKRELENLQFLKDRLQARLLQEKLDARLAEKPGPGAR